MLEAFRWYEERSPGLGSEFRDAVAWTIQRIAAHPEAYRVLHRGLRHALVRRFPHAVYFRLFEDAIVVVGVIHVKRHPRVAKAR